MSVVAQSPFSGSKRYFSDNDTPEVYDQCQSSKRARCFGGPQGRFPFYESHTILHPATLSAVRALFPEMDEQVLSEVLAECGPNIDAAIRKLNQLRLTQREDVHSMSRDEGPGSPVVAGGGTGGGEGVAEAGLSPHHPRTGEGWVDLLVQEMAAASDLEDARRRAARVLQSFEAFLTARKGDVPGTPDKSSANMKLEEVLRENVILKKAVQIQNAKLQESTIKDQEIESLKHLVSEYQEKVKALELNNYSLALHLQKATSSHTLLGQRNPDVY